MAISLTRRKVSGSSRRAWARLVRGPMATMVIVSGSFSRRRRRISQWEGCLEGMKGFVFSEKEAVDARLAASVGQGAWKACSQASCGERFSDDGIFLQKWPISTNSQHGLERPHGVKAFGPALLAAPLALALNDVEHGDGIFKGPGWMLAGVPVEKEGQMLTV
ncbi:hypothetical protein KEM55_008983 [Ascosphaera atra]|nr:hypothetical protein KEM55_008983 [Ascosphaera atra]